MDCGLLRQPDARKWKHWWTVRGHIATLVKTGKPYVYQCYLAIEKEMKP